MRESRAPCSRKEGFSVVAWEEVREPSHTYKVLRLTASRMQRLEVVGKREKSDAGHTERTLFL